MAEGRPSGTLKESCLHGLQCLARLLYATVQEDARAEVSPSPPCSFPIVEDDHRILGGCSSQQFLPNSTASASPHGMKETKKGGAEQHGKGEEEWDVVAKWKEGEGGRGSILHDAEVMLVHHLIHLLGDVLIPQLSRCKGKNNTSPAPSSLFRSTDRNTGSSPSSKEIHKTARRSYLFGTAALLCAWLLDDGHVDISMEEMTTRWRERCRMREVDPSSWWWVPPSFSWRRGRGGRGEKYVSNNAMGNGRGRRRASSGEFDFSSSSSYSSLSWLRLVLQAAVQPWLDERQLEQLLSLATDGGGGSSSSSCVPNVEGSRRRGCYAVSLHPPSFHDGDPSRGRSTKGREEAEESKMRGIHFFRCHGWLWETLTGGRRGNGVGGGNSSGSVVSKEDTVGDGNPGGLHSTPSSTSTTNHRNADEARDGAEDVPSGLGEDIDLLHYYLDQVFQVSRRTTHSLGGAGTRLSRTGEGRVAEEEEEEEEEGRRGSHVTCFLLQRPVPVSASVLSRLVEIKGLLCYDAAVGLTVSAVHSILYGYRLSLLSTTTQKGADGGGGNDGLCHLIRTVYARRCPELFTLLVWSMHSFRIASSQWGSVVAEKYIQHRLRPALFGCLGAVHGSDRNDPSHLPCDSGSQIEERDGDEVEERRTSERGREREEREIRGRRMEDILPSNSPSTSPPLLEVHPFVELSMNFTPVVLPSSSPSSSSMCRTQTSLCNPPCHSDPEQVAVLPSFPSVSCSSSYAREEKSGSGTVLLNKSAVATAIRDPEQVQNQEEEKEANDWGGGSQRIGVIAVHPIQEGELLSREWPLASWCRGDVDPAFFHPSSHPQMLHPGMDSVIGGVQRGDAAKAGPATSTATASSSSSSSSALFSSPKAALADQLLTVMRTAESLLCQQIKEGTLYQGDATSCSDEESHERDVKGGKEDKEAKVEMETGPYLLGSSFSRDWSSSSRSRRKEEPGTPFPLAMDVHSVAKYWRLLTCLSFSSFSSVLWAVDSSSSFCSSSSGRGGVEPASRLGRQATPPHFRREAATAAMATAASQTGRQDITGKRDSAPMETSSSSSVHNDQDAFLSCSSFPLIHETSLLQAGLDYFAHHPRSYSHPAYSFFTQDLYPPPAHSSIGIADLDAFKIGLSVYPPHPNTPPPSSSTPCASRSLSSFTRSDIAVPPRGKPPPQQEEVEEKDYWSRVGIREAGRGGYYFSRFYSHSCSPNVLLIFPEKSVTEKLGNTANTPSPFPKSGGRTGTATPITSHSSTSNSGASTTCYTGEVVAIALRAIEPGEELCVSYLQSSPLSLQLSSRKIKADALSFLCHCGFCVHKARWLEGTYCPECGERVYSTPEDMEKGLIKRWGGGGGGCGTRTSASSSSCGAPFGSHPLIFAAPTCFEHAEDCPRRNNHISSMNGENNNNNIYNPSEVGDPSHGCGKEGEPIVQLKRSWRKGGDGGGDCTKESQGGQMESATLHLEAALQKCYKHLIFEEDSPNTDQEGDNGANSSRQSDFPHQGRAEPYKLSSFSGGGRRGEEKKTLKGVYGCDKATTITHISPPSSSSHSNNQLRVRSRLNFLHSLLQLDAASASVFPTEHYLRLRLRQELVVTASTVAEYLSLTSFSPVLPIATELLEDVLFFFPSPHPVATNVRMHYVYLRAAYITAVETNRRKQTQEKVARNLSLSSSLVSGGAFPPPPCCTSSPSSSSCYPSPEEKAPYPIFTFGGNQISSADAGGGGQCEEVQKRNKVHPPASSSPYPVSFSMLFRASSQIMEKPFSKDPVLRSGIIQSFQEHFLQMVSWKDSPAWWQQRQHHQEKEQKKQEYGRQIGSASSSSTLSEQEEVEVVGKGKEVAEEVERTESEAVDYSETEVLSSFLSRFPVELGAAGVDSTEGISMLSLMEDPEERENEKYEEEEEEDTSLPLSTSATDPPAHLHGFGKGEARRPPHDGRRSAMTPFESLRWLDESFAFVSQSSSPSPLPGDFYPTTTTTMRNAAPGVAGATPSLLSSSCKEQEILDFSEEALGALVEEGSDAEIEEFP